MLGRLLDRIRRRRPGPVPDRTSDAELAVARAHARAGRMQEALDIWRRLAEAGERRAWTNLGACYATGAGVPMDLAAARDWLGRGAEAGDPLGQRNLAALLLPEDPALAAAWFRRAAEGGDAESQDQLSRMLSEGQGIPKDAAEARHWAEQAAGQGYVPACAQLAMLWHEGEGGPRDPAQAAHWWRLAAQGGHAGSAAMLGGAYHLGLGVEADQVVAMAWLVVAARRHSPLVRGFYDRVEALLSPDDLARAQALAADLDGVASGTSPSG